METIERDRRRMVRDGFHHGAIYVLKSGDAVELRHIEYKWFGARAVVLVRRTGELKRLPLRALRRCAKFELR